MARKKKSKDPLVVGQTVWIESMNMFYKKDRELRKMVVLEANKSSAYIWYDEKESDRDAKARYRVEQRTHEVHGVLPGYSYRLWLTKEDYEVHIAFMKEKAKTRKFVEDYVSSSLRTLNELSAIKEFIESTKVVKEK